MSTQQSATAVSSSSPAFGRLALPGLLIAVVAVVLNTLIAMLARTLFSITPAFSPLQPVFFISATVVGVIGAVAVAMALMRWSKQPRRQFLRIGLAVLCVSVLPDLSLLFVHFIPGATVAEVGTVALMHVLTGLLCLGILSRSMA